MGYRAVEVQEKDTRKSLANTFLKGFNQISQEEKIWLQDEIKEGIAYIKYCQQIL